AAAAKKTVKRQKATRAAVRRAGRPAAKKASAKDAAPPKPPSNAELIVRQGFIIDATGKAQHAVPEVVVIGNRHALRWLADVFAYLADQAAAHRSHEPHAGVHIMRLATPVNARLSDAIEFRFIPVVDANRAATFKRHGVTMKSREHGSLFERYVGVAETDFTKVARRLERDARREADRKP
ncbi:MAG: hypothetical protein D6744_07985, partial [Planctomycetota bacterium]